MKSIFSLTLLFICFSFKNNKMDNAFGRLETTEVVKDLNEKTSTINDATADCGIIECMPSRKLPKFSIAKREREDFNAYTPRTRYHIRTPKIYEATILDDIADSILRKEIKEFGIGELYINYYLNNQIIKISNSYGISACIKGERSSSVFKEEKRIYRYNPPKPRDLSNATTREKQLWGAFDQGRIAGYEVGYRDGKKKKYVYSSFNSDYPTSDEWIKQSYKQGYETGYLDGFDDAGGER